MPAPRTRKQFKDDAAIIEWLQGRRPGAQITAKMEGDHCHRFVYETDQVRGSVCFVRAVNSNTHEPVGDLYQWSSSLQWEDEKLELDDDDNWLSI